MDLGTDVNIIFVCFFPEKVVAAGAEVSEHFVYSVILFFIAMSYTCKLFLSWW